MVETAPETDRAGPLRVTGALILREVTATHGRAAGGYLWAVLEPVGGIVLLSVLFALAFRAPPLGGSFALFYASGVLPFMMYMDISQKLAVALRVSRPLMMFPAVGHVEVLAARLLLAVLTQAVVFALILGGLGAITGRWPAPAALGAGFALAAALGVGVGTLNCYLATRFALWERLWAVTNRPLFAISGIFFLVESVARPWRDWLWFNPLVHLSGLVRRALYPAYRGDYISPLYVLAIAGVTLALGLALLARGHREILDQ